MRDAGVPMTHSDAAALSTAVVLMASLVGIIGAIGVYLWYGWALSRLFSRLGVEGWRGWVPVLNEMTIYERGGIPAWNVVFYFVPIANLYALYLKYVAAQRIGEPLGKGPGYAVMAALISPLWATLLGSSNTADARAESTHNAASAGDAGAAGQAGAAKGAGDDVESRYTEVGSAAGSVAPPMSAPEPGSPGARSPEASGPADGSPIELDWPPEPFPPTPMPEPAPPEHPNLAGIADSDPIHVHNPWMRATTLDAVPSEPGPAATIPPMPGAAPSQSQRWLDESASAAALEGPLPSETDDNGGADDETVVVDRRPRVQWHLHVEGTPPMPLVAERVLLGRRPSPTAPGTQVLAIPDTTRTLSKSHARLDLVDGAWTITDLDSTNGILLVDDAGEESEITAGEAVPVPGRFILGEVSMHISFEEAER